MKMGFQIIDDLLPGGLSSLYPTLPVKTNYTRPSVLVLNSDTELGRENASRHDGFIIVMTLLVAFFIMFHVYPNICMCFSREVEDEESVDGDTESAFAEHLQTNSRITEVERGKRFDEIFNIKEVFKGLTASKCKPEDNRELDTIEFYKLMAFFFT